MNQGVLPATEYLSIQGDILGGSVYQMLSQRLGAWCSTTELQLHASGNTQDEVVTYWHSDILGTATMQAYIYGGSFMSKHAIFKQKHPWL